MAIADELTTLRTSKGLKARDMAEVIRRHYPKFDKSMLSKCENGEQYGVVIRSDALDALYAEFAPELLKASKRAREGGHSLPCRISARFSTEDYEALQRRMKADGYATNQDLLTALVRRYIQGGGDHGP